MRIYLNTRLVQENYHHRLQLIYANLDKITFISTVLAEAMQKMYSKKNKTQLIHLQF